jgi:hypothetical protein
LIDKGINNYIIKLDPKKRDSRILYSFLYKRQRRALKRFFKQRWVFLMSSRPLDKEKYLNDTEDISDEFLPPLMEMGTIYYYKMNSNGDNSPNLGSIKCEDINSIDMTIDNKYFTFTIDAGKKKYEFCTLTRAQCQQWIEAINIAKQT